MVESNEISTATVNHFTKFDNLVSIIQTKRFEPHYCLENVEHLNWRKILGVNEQELESIPKLAYPMVCFTDLPHDKWPIHKSKYGDCVITMSEVWKLRNGLQPVIYLMHGSLIAENLLPNCLRFALTFIKSLPRNIPNVQGYENFINLFCVFLKPYSDGQHNYYDEREWRYIPWRGLDKQALCLSEEDFKDKEINDLWSKRLLNDNTNLLCFEYDDIVSIEVPSEIEKEKLVSVLAETFKVDLEVIKEKILIS